MKPCHFVVMSVDWDYFFPDTFPFDWGHNEDQPLFFEAIWSTRAGSRNLQTKQLAIDVMRPNEKLLNGFWKKTVWEYEPLGIAIGESHAAIYKSIMECDGLDLYDGLSIYNFDAHHDCYPHRDGKLNCGNWGLKLGDRVKEFHQFYPEWRKESPDARPARKISSTTYGLPDKPINPHLLFVCRSSCWTPSWSDDRWLKFTGELSKFVAWQHKGFAPFVMKKRNPDLKAAQRLALIQEKQRKEWMKGRALSK